jgi:hypothetical protein
MNELNAKTLKYYIALQPKIREAMGEWQVHDPCWHPEFGLGIVFGYATKNHLSAHFSGYGNIYERAIENFIRLPLPIDPRNPERGCWFMLTKENRSDKTFLNKLASSDNPELVILKKLANQEGV